MKKTLAIIITPLSLATISQAQSIVTWDFRYAGPDDDRYSGLSSAPATILDDCVESGLASLSDDVRVEDNPSYGLETKGWESPNPFSRGLNFKFALGGSTTGTIDSISFDQASHNQIGYAAGPTTWAVQIYDSNGYIVAKSTPQTPTGSPISATSNSVFGPIVNAQLATDTALIVDAISGGTFNVVAGETYIAEYSAWGAQNKDGILYLGEVNINGSLKCIPEPSSSALLGFAAIGLLARRKRS